MMHAPTSEIYWPRHRGPGCPDADTLFYRISASSRNIFIFRMPAEFMRAPHQVVFPMLRELRSSHTRKKSVFFAPSFPKNEDTLPPLFDFSCSFRFVRAYLPPFAICHLIFFCLFGSSASAVLPVFCWRSALYPREPTAERARCAGGLVTRSADIATYNVALRPYEQSSDSQSGFANLKDKRKPTAKLVLRRLKASCLGPCPSKFLAGSQARKEGAREVEGDGRDGAGKGAAEAGAGEPREPEGRRAGAGDAGLCGSERQRGDEGDEVG